MDKDFPIALTHTEKNCDGFGENYKTIVLTMAFAEFQGIKYVYSPFKELCHSVGGDDFIMKLEDMINLKEYLDVNGDLVKDKYNVCRIRKMDLLSFYDNHIDFFEKSHTFKLIKKAFNEKNVNPWPELLLNSQVDKFLNVAIHIRRPDNYDCNLFNGNPLVDRLGVPSDMYVSIIKQLLGLYNNCKIHIYSQLLDNINEFDQYKSINEEKIILHIDEPLDKTFIEMVYADVLVMAPSTLSYMAGILSNNIVYYIEFSCPPLSHWNIIKGYSCEKLYRFFVKNVDLSVSYNSKTDTMSVENLDMLRSRID